MALKKPSEYFKKDIPSVDNSIQELVKAPELNTFSDAFQSFKNNLSKIEVLSDFSETLDNYRVNIERVNHLSSSIEDIKTEIQTLLKKEDLDRAMMSQLLVVEQSIQEVQNKVKGINEKNLTEIRLDVAGLTENVNEFLEIEVPKYKKLIVDSELRTSARYEELEENVNQTLEGIGEFVDGKYQELTETLEGINEKSLTGILEDFKLLERNLEQLKEEEIPKYKGFIVETERKTEAKLDKFDDKLSSTLVKFEENVNQTVEKNHSSLIEEIKELENDFTKIKEQDIPKYKAFIVETEIKTESKINDFQRKLDETVSNVLEKISLIEDDKTDLVNEVVQKIEDVKNLNEEVSKELKDNEVYKNEINEKISDLRIEIVRNETHIKVQNKTLKSIQEEVKDTLSKINLEEFEEKSHKLNEKIKYLEEVFEKFSEREILTENIVVEPPSTDNKDPLTPLDKNFVTLEQLQEHYRLFINRIQQQLATIGGGGETRLEFLDDIDRDSAKQDGYVLQYSSAAGKFIGTSYVPGGGGGTVAITTTAPTSPTPGNIWYDSEIGRTFIYYQDENGSQWVDVAPSGTSSVGVNYWGVTNAGIYTTGNVAIGTNVVSSGSTALWVQGDARITGILSVGQGTITINGNTNTISATGINASGIVTGSSFRPSSGYYQSANGTNSFYVYDGTGNVAFQGTIGASKINNASGYLAIDFTSTATPDVLIPNSLIVSGFSSSPDTRINSASEKSAVGTGNTVSLVYNTGGGNIGIITSPSGPITLRVTGIPTDSSFNNRVLTFSVIVNQGVTGYACSTVTLNGVSATVKYPGAVVSTGSTSAYDIFNFTCINPVGSASTTSNYVVLGMVNGNFK